MNTRPCHAALSPSDPPKTNTPNHPTTPKVGGGQPSTHRIVAASASWRPCGYTDLFPPMEVRPVHSDVPFAEVHGADLKSWLAKPAQGREHLRQLISTHGLVVFKSASLTPREEVQLSKLAGYHAARDPARARIPGGGDGGWNGPTAGIATLPEEPDVLCQGNSLLTNHHGISSMQLSQKLCYNNEGFHCDGVHNMQERLPVLTSMYCIKAPLAGGETYFACGRLAFARLDPAIKELCRRMTVHYAYDEGGGLAIMRDGIERIGRAEPAKCPEEGSRALPLRTAHPLVRVHEDTGEESIYLSCANIEYMEAPPVEGAPGQPAVCLDEVASYDFVRTLLGGVAQAPIVYAHRWHENDFAIWDNRLLLHAPGREATCVGERLHHRVRLDGSDEANDDLVERTMRLDLAAAHTLSHHFKFDEVRSLPSIPPRSAFEVSN